MGKNRRAHAQRKATIAWVRNIALVKEDIPGLIQGILISIAIAYLFYKSAIGMLVGVAIVPLWLKKYRSEKSQINKEKRQNEFKEYMLLVSNALQAGYSLEKSFSMAGVEISKLFNDDCLILKHVKEMNSKIGINIQVEKAFMEFAEKIDIEEAANLAEILAFAKRAGGDYGKHIRVAASKIEEKLLIQQEINVLTAEKRLELKIMCAMPLFILLYISVTSSGFVEPLYNNLVGVIIMTVSLIIYMLMIFLGKRIIKIEV